jgi:hypothetical protein
MGLQFLSHFHTFCTPDTTSYMRPHVSGTHYAFFWSKTLVGTWYQDKYRHSFPIPPFFCEHFSCKNPLDDHVSYLFFSSKSLNWHFLVWHKPPLSQCSTTQDWNLQVISNLVNRLIVACLKTAARRLLKRSLHLIAFQLVPSTSFHSKVQTFLATKSFAAGFSMDPCHMARFTKSVPRNVILWLAVVPNCIGVQWVWWAVLSWKRARIT